MSERKDEKWLDHELRRAVDGTTPVFAAEAWKQKHRAEYEMLLSRQTTSGPLHAGTNRSLRLVLSSPFRGLAVAAAVMVVGGILLLGRLEPDSHPVPGRNPPAQSPAQMMTMMSLQAAYRQGGTEGLEQQFDRALKMLGPRTSMSSKELLES